MSPAAVVEAVYLTTLAEQMKTATDTELTAIALDWAALPGHIAADARHLIDEQFEYRLAVARLNEMELAR